jgi:hypothetical protein
MIGKTHKIKIVFPILRSNEKGKTIIPFIRKRGWKSKQIHSLQKKTRGWKKEVIFACKHKIVIVINTNSFKHC